MSQLIRKTSVALFATAFSIAGMYAINANADDSYAYVPHVVVRYGDLDLSTDYGATALYQRLQSASRLVCRAFDKTDLSQRAKWNACYQQALSGAVNKVNRETVSALYKKSASKSSLS